MRILIEEHQYDAVDVKDVLHGIDALENVEGKVSIQYVGYYYNAVLQDCVFILPKVLLNDKSELVFGKYKPEDVINLNENNPLSPIERNFIYKFAVWIYRAIVVYKNSKEGNSEIVYHRHIAQIGNGHRRLSNTYLDILLSLIQFNKDNQIFFFTIVKNMHSGINKINWTRTISTTTAIVQNGQPIYLNPVNKKRQINFDEELLIIFFSILNYIGDEYGFPKYIVCQFQLITGKRFETYLKGFGTRRLRQIKYKYFSDKALQLWHLCYAFFDETRQIFITTEKREYLLVKSFYIVFETIIDELVGDNPLPDGMEKQQEDGKIVDHLFTARSLIDSEEKQTYYIGDSKYYKIGHELGAESVYKQYTYARNVIQWNLDIFNDGNQTESSVKLRDDVTEGYNIIPNFFISAKLNDNFDYSDDGIKKTDRKHNKYKKIQFKNRLFDRDTLLLFHYDVNFLFVLSLYARNNAVQKTEWKTKIRNKFRQEIQDWLQKDYNFYAMKTHPDVNGEEYIKKHFKQLLGKIYTPFRDNTIYSLALDNGKENEVSNKYLLDELAKSFYIAECKLGDEPRIVLQEYMKQECKPSKTAKNGVLMVMMESYDVKSLRFIPTGKLAVGVKYTRDGIEIAENLHSIGYVLFHTRKDIGQHLFHVKNVRLVKFKEEVESEIYKSVNTAEIYVVIEIDNSQELDASDMHSSMKKYTPTTRYDAQYANIEEITTNNN